MSATLANAPLVELIAEARWHGGRELANSPSEGGGSGAARFVDAKALEEFYERFGLSAYKAQFAQSERLAPVGAMVPMHQPVYRFKKLTDDVPTCIYQVGPGLFSANAVPPYKSWAEFEPVIRAGVEALISTRPTEEREQPFMELGLRYVDLFGAEHLRGMSARAFIRDVLGIRVEAPPALAEHCQDDGGIKIFLQMNIPIKDALIMSFSVGEGVAGDRQGVIMDTSITTTADTQANVEAVMLAFNAAHKILDASFRKLVSPLADVVSPRGA